MAASADGDALATVDDYVTGVMDEGRADEFEQALFAAAGGGAELDAALVFHDRLLRTATRALASGTWEIGATRREVDALLASGRRIDYAELDQLLAGEVSVPSDAAVELVIVRLPVDLTGVEQVDFEITEPGGRSVKTIRDFRFDAADGALYAVCAAGLARTAFARPDAITRIVGQRAGRRDVLRVIG
ncbi:MAG TPA: hypothetical protein VGG33_14060 [Polyangia bacterium]